jgi:hypothetical protein
MMVTCKKTRIGMRTKNKCQRIPCRVRELPVDQERPFDDVFKIGGSLSCGLLWHDGYVPYSHFTASIGPSIVKKSPLDLKLPVHEQQGLLALACCNSYLEA